jgi:hypothetical protein
VLLLVFALPGLAESELSKIRAETRLEKRAGMAMEYADTALKAARKAYLEKGDLKQANAALEEIRMAVELAYQSLVDTGKNASRRPKHFKRAEIKSRDLLRRLADFRDHMAFDDRATIDNTRSVVQRVQGDLLAAIMGAKK